MQVYIISRSPAYRLGIALALQTAGIATPAIQSKCVSQVVTNLPCHRLSLVVLDSCQLDDDLQELKHLASCERVRVLVLTDTKDLVFMRRILFHGALGTVPKTAPMAELVSAIEAVKRGSCWRYDEADEAPITTQYTRLGHALCRLSHRENCVLALVCSGLRNKQIALEMQLTEHTIKTHISNILRKLSIENRTQLVVALRGVKPPNAMLAAYLSA